MAEEKMKQVGDETEEKMKKTNCENASVDADFTAQVWLYCGSTRFYFQVLVG